MKKRFLMLFMMLLLSALVVTAAGYAWFTASAQAQVEGTQIKAETQGVLKVWTENNADPALPNAYANYTTLIDFAEPTDPFYNPAYAMHTMKDQSGNGATFVEATSVSASDIYGSVSGFGVALVYNLYFSAYTGNVTEGQTRDIFLSDLSIANATGTLMPSVRVGFLDNNDNIYGIYVPTGGQANFASEDLLGDPVSTDDEDLDGKVISSTTFDGVDNIYTAGDATTVETSTAELVYVKPAGTDATTIRRVIPSSDGSANYGTSICQIDASVVQPTVPTLKVVVWIEGTDPNTTDAKLSHEVSVDMTFQARMPSDVYSITYYTNGGSNNVNNTPTFALADFDTTETVTGLEIVEASEILNLLPLGNPTRPGYVFAGWYNDPGFAAANELLHNAGDTVWYLRTTDFAANRTIRIYANWTE